MNAGLSGDWISGGGFNLHLAHRPIVCGDLLPPRRSRMSSRERCGQTSDGDTEGDEEIDGSELLEPAESLRSPSWRTWW